MLSSNLSYLSGTNRACVASTRTQLDRDTNLISLVGWFFLIEVAPLGSTAVMVRPCNRACSAFYRLPRCKY